MTLKPQNAGFFFFAVCSPESGTGGVWKEKQSLPCSASRAAAGRARQAVARVLPPPRGAGATSGIQRERAEHRDKADKPQPPAEPPGSGTLTPQKRGLQPHSVPSLASATCARAVTKKVSKYFILHKLHQPRSTYGAFTDQFVLDIHLRSHLLAPTLHPPSGAVPSSKFSRPTTGHELL